MNWRSSFPVAALPLLFVSLGTSLPQPDQEQIGAKLPKVKLTSFSNTKAKSLKDFAGRAVLFEFFAYW